MGLNQRCQSDDIRTLSIIIDAYFDFQGYYDFNVIILGLAEIRKCYIVHHILNFIYSLNYFLTGLVARKIAEMFNNNLRCFFFI